MKKQEKKKPEKSIFSHFSNIGISTQWTGEQVIKKLKKIMPEERFQEFMNLANDMMNGQKLILNIYNFVESFEEANLLISRQGNISVKLSESVYSAIKNEINSAKFILELGCWTGALCSYIALKHPDCKVFGADRINHLPDFAKKWSHLENLNLVKWDYEKTPPEQLPKFDIIVSVLGIDFSYDYFPSSSYSDEETSTAYKDLETYRKSKIYQKRSEFLQPYFRNFRVVASQEKSILVMALRIPNHYMLFVVRTNLQRF